MPIRKQRQKRRLKTFIAIVICMLIALAYPYAVFAAEPSSSEGGSSSEDTSSEAEEPTQEEIDAAELEEYISKLPTAEAEAARQLVEKYNIKTWQELDLKVREEAALVGGAAVSFAQNVIQSANNALAQIGTTIKGMVGTDDGVVGVNYMNFARQWEGYFKVIAYALVLVCWGVGIIESAFQYELMTAKGLFKIFGKVLFAKIWIDLAVTICGYVIQICTDITIGIIDNITENGLAILSPDYSKIVYQSGIWIIGAIIDVIVTFFTLIPVMFVTFLAFVIAGIIVIKLIMRTFELAMLTTVSPVFFACWVSDATTMYFKRFLQTLIGVAAQIIFIAIVYAITVEYLPTYSQVANGADLVQYMAALNMWVFVVIAMGIMMIKPPKILTNLIG